MRSWLLPGLSRPRRARRASVRVPHLLSPDGGRYEGFGRGFACWNKLKVLADGVDQEPRRSTTLLCQGCLPPSTPPFASNIPPPAFRFPARPAGRRSRGLIACKRCNVIVAWSALARKCPSDVPKPPSVAGIFPLFGPRNSPSKPPLNDLRKVMTCQTAQGQTWPTWRSTKRVETNDDLLATTLRPLVCHASSPARDLPQGSDVPVVT